MQRFLFLLLLFLPLCILQAQENKLSFDFALSGGFNKLANLDENVRVSGGFDADVSEVFGLSVGARYRKQKLSYGFDLGFLETTKTEWRTFTRIDDEPGTPARPNLKKLREDYFTLRLSAGYHVNKKFSVFLGAASALHLNLSSALNIPDLKTESYDWDGDEPGNLQSTSYIYGNDREGENDIIFDVGARYRLGKRFFTELKFYRGIRNVQPRDFINTYNQGVLLSLGYTIR